MPATHGEQPTQDSSKPQQSSPNSNEATAIKPGSGLVQEIQQLLRNRARPKIQESPLPDADQPGATAPAPAPRHTSPLENRRAAYRHWLEGRSKEDLIELIVGLEGREPTQEATRKVTQELAKLLDGPNDDTYPVPENLPYMRLPSLRRTDVHQPPSPTWQIVLVAIDHKHELIGLQIDGEITVGRTTGAAIPDLDLTPYGAKTSGVSRYHACIRPMAHDLMLIDNDSSNGTFLNQTRLETQTEQPLKDHDIITFGHMSFMVRIVKSPGSRETRTVL